MKYEERIAELEKEIEQFTYERLKRQEQTQQLQVKLQQELAEISQAVLTRQGGIIELKRLIREEELKKQEAKRKEEEQKEKKKSKKEIKKKEIKDESKPS